MNYILCRNRVRNFDYWKGVFDSHAADHRAAGLKLVHFWYELASPHNVFLLFEAENVERARAFLESPDASASARASGVIEGDVLFFSKSLGYGLLNEAESRAFAAAMEGASATNNSVSAEPANSAEREQSAAPEKSPAPSESATTTEPKSTEPKAIEAAKSSPAPGTMKGPERAKNAPPLEVVDGWQPVENWPPAEAAAEVAGESAQRHRGRWMRKKY